MPWQRPGAPGTAMLSRLGTAWRVRSAGMLAALYLACVLAPAAAFALGDAARSAHCLGDGAAHVHDEGAGADTHGHHDGAAPDDGQDQGSPAAGSGCCGLFCVSLLPASIVAVEAPARLALVEIPLASRGVTGGGPDILYRPPISLLPS